MNLPPASPKDPPHSAPKSTFPASAFRVFNPRKEG